MAKDQNLVVAELKAHPRYNAVDAEVAAVQPATSSTPPLREYLRIAWRHKYAMLTLGLLGLLTGVLVSITSTPVYRSELKMVVEEERSNTANTEGGVVMAYPSWRYYETQYEIIRSRLVAEKAVETLGLVEEDFPIDPPRVERREQVLGAINSIRSAIGMLPEKPEHIPADRLDNTQRLNKQSGLINTILGSLGVSGGDDTQMVKVQMESPDPVFAADVANAVAQAYIDLRMEKRVDRVEQAGSWLAERVAELREKLTESEQALQKYRASRNIINLKSQEALTGSRLGLLNAAVVDAQGKVTELAKRYGGKHPKLVAAQRELYVARQRLEAESSKAVDTQTTSFELATLEREVDANRELYELFLQRFKEADLSRDYDIASARIVDPARPAGAPYKPNSGRIIAFFSILGLLLGALLAILREAVDNKFKSFENIEAELRLPVLGVVPLIRKVAAKVPPERGYIADTTSPFAESLNHVRTGVLFSDMDNPPKTVLVTSAVQGEGKTTLSSNLALSFAQVGRTLIIDTDLRKPRIGAVTGLSKRPGLVELLAGQVDLQTAVNPDPVAPNLFVLHSGAMPPNPLQLLSSPRFAQLLQILTAKFDHIVLDAAPVLPVSDAIVLGRLVDAVILAIRAEETSQSVVREAVKRLSTSNVNPRGIVLTQFSVKKAAYYGGDYYSRYYSYYSHKKPEGASTRSIGKRLAAAGRSAK